MDAITPQSPKKISYPLPTEGLFALAISGHVGAGKSTYTDRLLIGMDGKEIPAARYINYKNRALRPSELDSVDYHFVENDDKLRQLREEGKISDVEFTANQVHYWFSRDFIDALNGGARFPVVNVNLSGLVRLRQYMEEQQLSSKLISIGLYCGVGDAQHRIFSREHLTGDQVDTINYRIKQLPAEMDMYRRNAPGFRYLFYNSKGIEGLDHIVDRTLSLFAGEKGHGGIDNNIAFRQAYVGGLVGRLFNMEPRELIGKIAEHQPVELSFSKEDMDTYEAGHGKTILPGDPSSFSKVAAVVSAYGILTVLIDETAPMVSLNAEGQQQRRTFLQDMLRMKLGVPQNEGTGAITKSPVLRESLVESENADMALISSFSPYDMLPLLAGQEGLHLPNVADNRYHALVIGSAYKHNGVLDVQPLPKKEVMREG